MARIDLNSLIGKSGNLTEMHIGAGMPHSPSSCPVALCLNGMIGNLGVVTAVSSGVATIDDEFHPAGEIHITQRLRSWIVRFDDGMDVPTGELFVFKGYSHLWVDLIEK